MHLAHRRARALVVLALLAGCAGPRLSPRPASAPAPTQDQPERADPGPEVAPEPARELVAESPDGEPLPVLHTIKHDTGLVIEDLRVGSGADCMPGSVITVRYHGTLPNGIVIDTTRGKDPARFPLEKLIRGWREGLPGMKVGGVRRLFIPSALAYGDRQKGIIPPNSDLVFTIELLGVGE